MLIESFDLIWLQTRDLDRSLAFYRDVLGGIPGYVSPDWADLSLGGIKIGLHPVFLEESLGEGDFAGYIPTFVTPDLKALRNRLTEAGAKIHERLDEIPGGVLLSFYDPDGHILQAKQPGITIKDLED